MLNATWNSINFIHANDRQAILGWYIKDFKIYAHFMMDKIIA